MSDLESGKVLVKRPARIKTGRDGRSVWADPDESAELELVSTQMLKVMLTSRDQTEMEAIEEAASGSEDGVLVRNPGNGGFEIIGDDELQQILAANDNLPAISRPSDATLEPLKDYPDDNQLSLVSTQALRRVLNTRDDVDEVEADIILDDGGSFNPYDRG
jgi:hypothetical protein